MGGVGLGSCRTPEVTEGTGSCGRSVGPDRGTAGALPGRGLSETLVRDLGQGP